MQWLISSDLHLSDRPKDGYRFGIFRWIAKQQEKYSPEATFLLGDLTQDKDNHSSALVNRTIDELTLLQPPVYILRGNHDGVDHNNPFFRFLNCIEGIHFIVEPTYVLVSVNEKRHTVMIPHCRTQEQFNAACKQMAPNPQALMLHQTIAGAIAETGRPLNGFSTSPIELLKPLRCYAGDVHKPQKCGPVTYIGAPYQIKFGDDFTPRVLLVNGSKEQNLYYPHPHKWTLRIRDADEIYNKELKAGDQVKLIIELAREEMAEWSEHKRKALEACKELGLEVFGVDVDVKGLSRKAESGETSKQGKTKAEIVTEFCKNENVSSQIKQVGLELLKG